MRSCWKSKESNSTKGEGYIKIKGETINANIKHQEEAAEEEVPFKEAKTVQGILEDSVILEDSADRSIFMKSPVLCCVSRITDHLLLSSATAADSSSVQYFKVTCVINAAAELPDNPVLKSKDHQSLKYYKISIYDCPSSDILSHLDYTSDIINKEISNGGRILVHCVAGISRSATICIAYLMKYHQKTLLESYRHVKTRRSIVRPNCGFFRQLIAYEKSLFGMTTVKMVYNGIVRMEIPDVYNEDYKDIVNYRRKRKNDVIRRH